MMDIIYQLNGQPVLYVQAQLAHVPMQQPFNHVLLVTLQFHLVDKM